MLDFIFHRTFGFITVTFGIVLLAFVVLYLVPGNPAQTIAGPRASKEAIERLSCELGLDKPLLIRFSNYMKKVLKGDFGRSVITDRPIIDSIIEKFPYTLKITFIAILTSVLFGVTLGVIGAIKQGTLIDKFITLLSVIGISVPIFLFGLAFLYIFAGKLKWFPTSAYNANYSWSALILPAFTLGVRSSAFLTRIVRSSLIEVLNQDYIRTAKAKGLSKFKILLNHALPNALIPIITVIALDFSSFLSGSVIVETIFDVPGLGRFTMDAILQRDYPVIQGIVMFCALIFVSVNFVLDLIYAYLNPKIRDEFFAKQN